MLGNENTEACLNYYWIEIIFQYESLTDPRRLQKIWVSSIRLRLIRNVGTHVRDPIVCLHLAHGYSDKVMHSFVQQQYIWLQKLALSTYI